MVIGRQAALVNDVNGLAARDHRPLVDRPSECRLHSLLFSFPLINLRPGLLACPVPLVQFGL
jgi:hypothetical protein